MYQIYKDGNAWCAVTDGFVNLQESIAGFGSDAVTALQNLLAILEDEEKKRCCEMRRWECGNCNTRFMRGNIAPSERPGCIKCKGGGQYVSEVL